MKYLFFAFLLSVLSTPVVRSVDFQEEVRPILNKKCFKCHTGPKAKGHLRMDTPDSFSLRIGGEKAVIIPGDVAKSLLSIKAGLPSSDGDAMPPPPARAKGAEPMTQSELEIVRKWIAEGAKFTASEIASSASADTSSAPPASREIQAWTNSAGATLQAAFVSSDGTNVTLRKEDGTEFTYLISNLNQESQELAKKLSGK